MVVGIIGGGASGMTAALFASENPDVQVVLMERQSRVGKKLLATGNGRCNLSNVYATGSRYHGEDPEFSHYALESFNSELTLDWFAELGLYTVMENSGRVYPYSDQANSVVDVLRLNLDRPNVQILTGFEVQKIKKTETGFQVKATDTIVDCHKLIIACGGLAGSKLGGSLSGYKLLAQMGHKSTKLRPALVQIKTDWNGNVGLKGVRTECKAEIYHNSRLFSASRGELQFTDYGLSGPVIFETSRDVCFQPGDWSCKLDFIPDWSQQELYEALKRRISTNFSVQELLTGILHNRLGRVLTQASGLNLNGFCKDLTDEDIMSVCQAVKGFEIPLSEPMGMDCAQVTAGGVLTCDFDSQTMGSRIVPGLYACGEVLDIDGDCGGFNLQWAWSSGRLAGLSAGKVEV